MLNSSPDSSVCYFFTRPHYYCITCVFLSCVPALRLVAKREKQIFLNTPVKS